MGGEAAADLTNMGAWQAQFVEAIQVRCGVITDGSHDHWRATEQHEVVSDVAGATAKLATHLGHKESHVQDMNLLGQDVILESIRKDHDVVEGKRTANKCRHVRSGVKDIKAIAGGTTLLGLDPELDGDFAIGRKGVGGRTRGEVIGCKHDAT